LFRTFSDGSKRGEYQMKRKTGLAKHFAIVAVLLVAIICTGWYLPAIGEEDSSNEPIVETNESGVVETGELFEEAGGVDAVEQSIEEDEGTEDEIDGQPTNGDAPSAASLDNDEELDDAALPTAVSDDGVVSITSDTELKSSEGIDYVVVNTNGSLTLTLNNFELQSDNGPAIAVESGSVNIVLVGTNKLQGAPGCAGIYVAPGATVTISGDGSLDATGGRGISSDELWNLASGEDSVNTEPAYLVEHFLDPDPDYDCINYGSGAGIGSNGLVLQMISGINTVIGDYSEYSGLPNFGSIIINSGTVVAHGGDSIDMAWGAAAGIGSGGLTGNWTWTKYWDDFAFGVSMSGSIVVNDGIVKAYGGTLFDGSSYGNGGAGIGLGGTDADYWWINDTLIEINGGNVYAQGGVYGAGIGGGGGAPSGKISIHDGAIVTAIGNSDGLTYGGAGIGGGSEAGVNSILIDGGTVKAYGNGAASGIGSGAYFDMKYQTDFDDDQYQYGSVVITGSAKVEAYGGTGTGSSGIKRGGAGIGAGCNKNGFDVIEISGSAEVYAYAGYHSQAIGGGSDAKSTIASNASKTKFVGSDIKVWMFNQDTQYGALLGLAEEEGDGHIILSDGSVVMWYTSNDDVAAESGIVSISNSAYAGKYTWSKTDSTINISYLGVAAATGTSELNTIGNWATVNVVEPEAAVAITPVSITGYVGGISQNNSSMPKLRYSVSTDLAMDGLTFAIHTLDADGNELDARELTPSPAEGTKYYLFPELGYDMGNVDVSKDDGLSVYRSNFLKLVDDSTPGTEAGTYTVELRTGTDEWDSFYVTATDDKGNTYLVDIATVDADGNPVTVTVRPVSSEEDLSKNLSNYLTAVVTDLEDNVVKDAVGAGKAFAVVPEGTVFKTNDDKGLGLLGTDTVDVTGYGNQSALVALLFDDMVVSEGDDTQVMMMEAAKNVAEVDSFEDWSHVTKYLDLVNVNDGNAVLTADQEITVYWPYPDGVTSDNADNYEFKLVHYTNMNREGYDSLEGVDVELIEDITPTEHGLMFTTKSFSPFTLLYKEIDKDQAEEPDNELTAPSDPVEDPADPDVDPDEAVVDPSDGGVDESVDGAKPNVTDTTGSGATVRPASENSVAGVKVPDTGDATALAQIAGFGTLGLGALAAGLHINRRRNR
jgi:hypothetical protein